MLQHKGKDLDHLASPPGFAQEMLLQPLKASGSSRNGAPLRRAPGLRWTTAR
jgi:hypothetical protein